MTSFTVSPVSGGNWPVLEARAGLLQKGRLGGDRWGCWGVLGRFLACCAVLGGKMWGTGAGGVEPPVDGRGVVFDQIGEQATGDFAGLAACFAGRGRWISSGH